MDNDGVRDGFALEITARVAEVVTVPVIASGGAGNEEHFLEVFRDGRADAALAAGVFHEGTLTVAAVKEFLDAQGIEVRR
jgi:cyclase